MFVFPRIELVQSGQIGIEELVQFPKVIGPQEFILQGGWATKRFHRGKRLERI
jgi:hypothetical protein